MMMMCEPPTNSSLHVRVVDLFTLGAQIDFYSRLQVKRARAGALGTVLVIYTQKLEILILNLNLFHATVSC